jgi:hypothetical protein
MPRCLSSGNRREYLNAAFEELNDRCGPQSELSMAIVEFPEPIGFGGKSAIIGIFKGRIIYMPTAKTFSHSA